MVFLNISADEKSMATFVVIGGLKVKAISIFFFLQATTNEIPAMTKDFSIDLQHLVLLHGFQLQGIYIFNY